MLRLEIPVITATLNEAHRTHWQKRRKLQHRLAWELRVAGAGRLPPRPFPRAVVRIERHSVGTPDFDGMVGGLKDLIDCLLPMGEPRLIRGKLVHPHPCGLGIVADDNPNCMELVPVAIRVPRRSEQKTVVMIEPA